MVKVIKLGSKVKVHYTGTLESGEVFDSSEIRKEPIEIEIGRSRLIKGFESALIGMKVDEEKEVTIESKDAYGPKKDNLIQKIPKSSFPEKMEIKKDTVLSLKDPEGNTVLAKITEVNEDHVKIDLNHLLAGQRLKFKIKIVSIE